MPQAVWFAGALTTLEPGAEPSAPHAKLFVWELLEHLVPKQVSREYCAKDEKRTNRLGTLSYPRLFFMEVNFCSYACNNAQGT